MYRFLISVLLILTSHLMIALKAQADVFSVTSTSCSGPGSITDAIQQANASAGQDTIEITPNLAITAINGSSCGLPPAISDPSDFYLGTVSEDLIINGNGATLEGNPLWVTPQGVTNVKGECPSDPNFNGTVVRAAPGFVRVEAGVAVQISDLTAIELSAFASIREDANLTLDNVFISRINDWFAGCDRSAILSLGTPTTLTINNSTLEFVRNSADAVGQPDGFNFWQGSMVIGQGTLNVSNSEFASGLGAINWKGTVNIVTSRFIRSGWVNVYGNSTANISNSIFLGREGFDDFGRIRASGTSTVNVTASTLYYGESDCPPPGCVNGFGVIIATQDSTINLSESAIGVGLPNDPGVMLRTATGGTITADDRTWMQPVLDQDPADLRAITSQPGLMTDAPGLPQKFFGADYFPVAITPLLGTQATPGVLIDAIADAEDTETNALYSPIDGAFIAVDALGNPRVDGNGTRTIGAVQLTLAPHTAVQAVTDTGASVSWSRPQDPDPTKPITGYGVIYQPTDGSTAPVRIDVAGAETTSLMLTGLAPGTTYSVTVVGVNVDGDGPPSNMPMFTTESPSVRPRPDLVASVPTLTYPALLILIFAIGVLGRRAAVSSKNL